MSTHTIPHQCQCGHRVNVGIEPDTNGYDYRVEFRIHATATGNSRTVSNCPRCKRNLYNALCSGELRDITCTATHQKACA